MRAPHQSLGMLSIRTLALHGLCFSAVLFLAACSGGSSSGASSSGFKVTGIGVKSGQEWKLNRPIDITFNRDVDFSTVSLNTIRVSDQQGNGATGFFTRPSDASGNPDPRRIRFQPACPTKEDNSDAGLQPYGNYVLSVLGSKVGGLTVRSTAGDVLFEGKLVTFHTPNTDDPLQLFLDTVPGPPAVRLRGRGGVDLDDPAATHAEVGGLPVYFDLDPGTQEGRLPAGFEVPLNHYSIPENRLAVMLHFNQPVVATDANLNSSLLRLEYFNGVAWTAMQTRVQLIENCTATGATVRLTPAGIVPQGSQLRTIVKAGFADLTGDATTADRTAFGLMDSVDAGGANPLFPGVSNPEADGVLVGFTLGGDDFASLEDSTAAFEVPAADWGGGQLQASFAFGGTGGPKGTFDWHIPPGTELVLDTLNDTIVGGENGVPETTQAVINGVVDIRNLVIPASSRLIVVGPNTCTILASGSVLIQGEISVRGSNSPGVGTLNTTNQPELGAKGQAGGGDGGTASFLTNQSTPRGGRGNGAFNTPNGGGEGGETSYANTGKFDRRGAGGGGGRFGLDVFYDHDGNPSNELVRCQTLVGLDAELGAKGGPFGQGAVSQAIGIRARGGDIGPGPFKDSHDDNNFFGVMLTISGDLITGELDKTFSGAGGGAGGDAVNDDVFPLTPWSAAGDEKGSGGGGGAGGLKILAIGPIQIGDGSGPGSIAAEGGDGGAGENTGWFDRVGSGSGGGSGGHIVLSSAAEIVIWGKAPSAEFWYTDDINAFQHDPRPISALGGGGGAGNDNRGGANEVGPTNWFCDRVPFENFDPYTSGVPPMDNTCWTSLPDISDPDGGPVVGAGGDGSPGIIQFHVEDPATRLRFPTLELEQGTNYGNGLDVTPCCAPPPLGWHTPNGAVDNMIPFFGRLSRSQSRWIALGLARIDPGSTDDQVVLRFEGTDASGNVPHDGSTVDQLPPIVGPDPLGASGSPPFIGTDGRTLVFDASEFSGQDLMLKDNPQLLLDYSVQLEETGVPTNFQRFQITAAEYDGSNDWLVTHVDANGPDLGKFQAGSIDASLVPHFLRLLTSGIADAYPSDTGVKVRFDATKIDPLTGLPDEVGAFGFTADIADLNSDAWDFVRFQVEFDLDTDSTGVDITTPRPGLDILRIDFGF